MQIEDSLSVHGRVQHIVASMPLLQSLCWTCRLKSLTLFSPLTAKAATVSNTNSLLSSYICSGQGCKDGSRSKKDVGQSFVPLCTVTYVLSLIFCSPGSTGMFLALCPTQSMSLWAGSKCNFGFRPAGQFICLSQQHHVGHCCCLSLDMDA